MRILINTRLLQENKLEGIGVFTHEIFQRICKNHPEHTFYFLFDRNYSDKFLYEKNVIPIKAGLPARCPSLYYLWFNFTVTKTIKKYDIDLFISPDGYLSTRTKTPSISVIHDLNFVHFPKDFRWNLRKYLNYFFPKFAKKAARIITVSEYSKNDIVETYKIEKNKIDIVYNASSSVFKPISEQEQESVREKYSQGQKYFLYVGALNPRKNIARLLTAFDAFRDQHAEDFKLIIVGEKMFKTESIQKSWDRMKYKKDVVFTGRLENIELSKLYASAYSLTYVSIFEGFGIPIVEAFACKTAVITSNCSSMPEIAGDAALFANPIIESSIAEAMLKMARDSELRNSLIKKGEERLLLYSWDNSAKEFWNAIEKTINK